MRRVWLAVLLVLALVLSAGAAEDLTARQAEILDTQSLEDALDAQTRSLLEGVNPVQGGDALQTLWRIVSNAVSGLTDGLRSAAHSLCMLLAAVLLCAMVESFGSGIPARAVTMAGALAVTGICTADLNRMIGLATDTIDRIANFTTLLLPVLSAAATAAGAPTTGAALYTGAVLFMDVLLALIRRLLIPMVYVFTALAAADCAVGQGRLSRLRALSGWGITISLKGVMYLFTAYLALTGIVGSASDSAGTRAVKAGLSAALPVVGSIVSDATQSVLAGAGAIKAAVGVFGLLALLAMGLLPFLRIAVQYLTLRVAAAAGSTAADSSLAALLGHLATAMGYMLAMAGCSVLMALICCCCFLKVTGG